MTVHSRGCGTRVHGGLYNVLPLGEGGLPLEDFLFDSPLTLEPGETIPRLGVSMFFMDDTTGDFFFGPDADTHANKHKGTWHILDVVGHTHYPSLADFLLEAYRQGLSRRLAHTLALDKLTPWDPVTKLGSRHFLLHDRAVVRCTGQDLGRFKIQNGIADLAPCRVQAYMDGRLGSLPRPDVADHWDGSHPYQAGNGKQPIHSSADPCLFDTFLFHSAEANGKGLVQTPHYAPSVERPYPVPKHSLSFDQISYEIGYFASFPIKLEMVQAAGLEADPEWQKRHDKAAAGAAAAGIPISVVPE